jgi:hypothetical protein
MSGEARYRGLLRAVPYALIEPWHHPFYPSSFRRSVRAGGLPV